MVIPSYYMVNSGPDKDALVQEYKEVVKEIPCKYFENGRGLCPFRNSCNYSHLLPNGTPYEYPWTDNKIIDGEWVMEREQTLADRIGFM